MALRQRNTTRWTARVGTSVQRAVYFVAEVLESLLNFKKGDELQAKGIKTADFVARRGVYFFLDYGLAALSLTIGITMKAMGFSLLAIFGALWAFDFMAAGFFIVIYEVTGKDLSLGEDFRRATDTISKGSRLAGYLTTLGVIVLAIAWTGPEKIITFFRKEIATIPRVIAVLAGLTSVQAFIWACIYVLGYDLTMKIF